jgi:hypothetical protein
MAMRRIALIIGFILLLFSNGGAAAPHAQYSINDPQHQTVAWELQDTLSQHFNYRLSAREQTQFRQESKEYTAANMMLDTSVLAGLVDWHPFAGSLRTSIGLFVNNYAVDYEVAPIVDWRFDGMTFDVDQELAPYMDDAGLTDAQRDELYAHLPDTVRIKPFNIKIDQTHISGRAQARFRKLAPYWGIGIGNAPFSENRWRYSVDLGLLFTGSPQLDASLHGKWMSIHPLITDEFNKLLTEEKAKLQTKADRYQAIPYFSLGLAYGFD